jgi:hypothetical protein
VTGGGSLAAFFSSAPGPVKPQSGNTEWAERMAAEVKSVIRTYTEWQPRSQQVHLGPSELGVECDRQVVGKLVRETSTNHVFDPWPSFMGTAGHAAVELAFQADNRRIAPLPGEPPDFVRWLTETRVVPHPEHSGTADLYDARERAVLDHKFLGDASREKVIAGRIPRKYRRQLLLYGLGYLRAGRPVDRVALIAYPRTRSTLDGLYVWETPFDASAVQELVDTFAETERRKAYAAEVAAGRMTLEQVPRTPVRDECYYCPFYRPEGGHGPAVGCPGTVG